MCPLGRKGGPASLNSPRGSAGLAPRGHQLAPASAEALRARLLAWFGREQRDLPWRRTRDPYAIWVSEVMLQQTQVERVIDYWPRFLERFPTIEALASADLSAVLACWRGLGYYSRARNMRRAAEVVVGSLGGKLPCSPAALLELPGFGRYTAGAVASIAFGLEAPVVDGNVARVLSRILEVEGRPGDRSREAMLWHAAAQLVQGERPGEFNQALMELGATVCVPRSPRCVSCPVQVDCRARARGRVAELPPPKRAGPRKRLELAVAVCRRGGRFLLARRRLEGLYGGLWELPTTPACESGSEALRGLLGPAALIGPEFAVLQRTLTHRDLVLRLHSVSLPVRLSTPPDNYEEWGWVSQRAARRLGMSSAMAAVLEDRAHGAAAGPRSARALRTDSPSGNQRSKVPLHHPQRRDDSLSLGDSTKAQAAGRRQQRS
jgi:A/G-specific adenine glycosylase